MNDYVITISTTTLHMISIQSVAGTGFLGGVLVATVVWLLTQPRRK